MKHIFKMLFVLVIVLFFNTGCIHNPLDPELNAKYKQVRIDYPFAQAMAPHNKNPEDIIGVWLVFGHILLEERPPWYNRLFPFGNYAIEYGAIASFNKPYLNRPALIPFAISIGITASLLHVGFVAVVPVIANSEEMNHIWIRIYHRWIVDAGTVWRQFWTFYWIPKAGPYISNFLYSIPPYKFLVYYTSIDELVAKGKKILFLTAVRNIHCPEAERQYEDLCGYIGFWKAYKKHGWTYPGSKEHIEETNKIRRPHIKSKWKYAFPFMYNYANELEPGPRWFPRIIL